MKKQKYSKFESSSKYEGFTEIQIEEFKEAFNVFDKDGNGFIDVKELRAVLNNLGENPSEEELMKLIEKVDEDKNGVIDFKEFIALINFKSAKKSESKNLISALDTFMQGDRYYTSSNEIKYFFLNSNLGLTEDEIDNLIDEIYIKENGDINYTKLYELFFLNSIKNYINI